MDQISASASKPGPSNTPLDPPSTNTVELMDIDYGPALPPRLDSHGRVNDASGFNVSSVEEPSRLPSAQPKKTYHSSKQYSLRRSSTAVMGLDDEKGRQEFRPRGPSSMLPLNSIIKDAFDKFDQDFQAANLPEGRYIRAPPSTAKW